MSYTATADFDLLSTHFASGASLDSLAPYTIQQLLRRGLATAGGGGGGSLTPTAVKTSNYTAAANDLVLTSSASGALVHTLPAGSNGAVVAFKKIGASDNLITIQPGGTDTIEGGANSVYLLGPLSTATLIYANSTWNLLSDAMSTVVVASSSLPGGYNWPGYFKASSVALADGASLTGWNNSGAGGGIGAFAISGSAPLYRPAGMNNLPAVEMDGSSQALSIATLASGNRPFTAVMAIQIDSTAVTNVLWGGQNAGDRNIRINTSGALEWDRKGTSVLIVTGNVVTAGVPHIIGLRDDGTNYKMYVDGTLVGTATNASGGGGGTSSSLGTDGSNRYDGKFGDICVEMAATGDTDFFNTTAWMAAKYGVTLA